MSSTHIAVGGVFGVGFLREYLARRESKRRRDTILASAEAGAATALHDLEDLTPELQHLPGGDKDKAPADPDKAQKKAIERRLVRRNHAWTIAAAWVITVPLAALLAAGLYYAMASLDLHP